MRGIKQIRCLCFITCQYKKRAAKLFSLKCLAALLIISYYYSSASSIPSCGFSSSSAMSLSISSLMKSSSNNGIDTLSVSLNKIISLEFSTDKLLLISYTAHYPYFSAISFIACANCLIVIVSFIFLFSP